MKKAVVLSICLHVLFIGLLLQKSETRKNLTENVYVVDLLKLPPSMDITDNVIPSFRVEPAEASISKVPQTNFQEKSHETSYGKIGSRITGGQDTSVEKFSPDEYMAQIKKKLYQENVSSSGGNITASGKGATSQSSETRKTSLASRIFPLTDVSSPSGISVGFQETGIPSGNIIPLEYLESIKIALQRKWKLPEEKNYSLTSVVSFKLKRDGTITDICLEKSSGVREFDDSALKAVMNTGRLPGLPDTYKLDCLEIAVKFNIRGIQ